MKDRIISIDSGVDSHLAHIVCQQIMYLDSISSEDIKVYLNSPGGSVHDGMKIQDAFDMARSDIVIIGSGMLCSMGCYLLSMGTPGKRFLTKRAQVMAHQVSAGNQGHVEDMRASFEHTDTLNDLLGMEIAKAVGKPHKQYIKDVNRDMWKNAFDSVMYGTIGFADGIIDGARDADGELIILKRSDLKKKAPKKVTTESDVE